MESEDTAENECSKEESESALKVVANEKSISPQNAQTDTTNVPETTQKEKEQKKQTFNQDNFASAKLND